MSRKAKAAIVLPSGVEILRKGEIVVVKGSKGSLEQYIPLTIEIQVDSKSVLVRPQQGENEEALSPFLGLYWSLLNNMVHGVTQGFQKELEMVGVGYRAAVQGDLLDLQIGFSHPTKVKIPKGILVEVEKNTLIRLKGIDKQLIGQFAAQIRRYRAPEPYKGKGIRYKDEYVRRKAGKAGKK